MASNKPQLPIEVPKTGVREDVNPMLRDTTMASKGDNCLYYDNAIRPRPALTKEIGTIEDVPVGLPVDSPPPLIPVWQRVFDGDGIGRTSTVVNISGILLTADYADLSWLMSVDGGETWTTPAFTWPAELTAPESPEHLMILPDQDLLLMFSDERSWQADISSFPTLIGAWTMADSSDTAAVWAQPPNAVYHYDADNDSVVCATYNYSNYEPRVYAINDISGAFVQDEIEPSATPLAASYTKTDMGSFVTLNDGTLWHLYPFVTYDGALGYTKHEVVAKSLIYTGGTWTYGTTEYTGTLWSNWDADVDSGGYYYNPLGWDGTVDCGRGIMDTGSEDGFMCLAFTRHEDETPSAIIKCPFDADGFGAEPIPWSVVKELPDLTLKFPIAYGQSPTVRYYAIPQPNDHDNSDSLYLPRLYATTDNGATWMDFIEVRGLAVDYPRVALKVGVSSSDASDEYFLHVRSDDSYTSIYQMPIGTAPTGTTGGGGSGKVATSPQGDVTTVFQLDLDDEDNAVIVGTTRQITRLDRTNGEWDRLTANSAETVDTGGLGVYIESGDIPPLSVHPDETEYVNNTTIDGTYGTNPWVFRTVEAQDKTFLIGTNGQCYPVAYHSTMEGGFARRLGEVPPGDPNDLPAFDADSFPTGYLRTGNLAPRARCMAVGANRVLLANLPGTSAYGVEVSGFNDPDRGWGLEQFTLLGDTPGSIVTMKEISALSIAMYKTDAIYHAVAQTEFMGVAAPFRFELSKAGIAGPCSPASVLRNFDGRQIYLARDGGAYMYDGVAPIDAGRNVRRMIQDHLDYNSLGKCWGMVDRQRKLIWFFFPTQGGLVNRGVVISTDQGHPWPAWPIVLPEGWNFVTGSDVILQDDITIGDVGRFGDYTDETLGSFASGEQVMLMGTKNNVWFQQKWEDDGDYTDDGIPIPIDLETGWVTPGQVDIFTVDELYHLFKGAGPGWRLGTPPIPPPPPRGEVIIEPTSGPFPFYRQLVPELQVRVRAQQIGSSISNSKYDSIYDKKLRRRTRHRVSGQQFAMQMKGAITRSFSWAGAMMSIVKKGKR